MLFCLTKTFKYISLTTTFDEISIDLEQVEVKRVSYSKTKVSNFERREQLIEPMNLKSTIKRNLTTNSNSPDLEIFLNLTDFKCIISLQSAKLLFAILNENLNEGLSKSSEQQQQTIEIVSVKSDKTTTKVKNNNSLVPVSEASNRDKLTLKLIVELNKIKLIIVEQKTLQVIAEPLTPTYQDFSLLQISKVLFDFNKYEADGRWNAMFKMKALKLNDLRPDSNLAVKEMFVPKTKDRHFIDLAYSMDAEANAKLNFNLDHLKINLCLPYILKLYSMVMEAVGSSGNNNNYYYFISRS